MNKSKKIISIIMLSVLMVFQLWSFSYLGQVIYRGESDNTKISWLFGNYVIAGPLDMNKQEGMGNANNQIGNVFGSNSVVDVRVVIIRYIKIFLSLLGMIFIILILLAGFKYMNASDEKDNKEALDKIKNAVIGLLIILASYGITVFVGNQINFVISESS